MKIHKTVGYAVRSAGQSWFQLTDRERSVIILAIIVFVIGSIAKLIFSQL
jgi:hypothetical protein